MPMRMRGRLPGSLEGAFMNGSCGGGSGSGPVCSRLEPPSPTRSSDHDDGLRRSFQLSAPLLPLAPVLNSTDTYQLLLHSGCVEA